MKDQDGHDAKNEIVKTYLTSKGINVKQLENTERKNGNTIARRSFKKLPGNEISVPRECTNTELKKKRTKNRKWRIHNR